MRSHIAPAQRVAALLLAVTTTLACGSFRLPFMGNGGNGYSGLMTEEELQNELAGYAARFSAVVNGAAEDISTGTTDRNVRRRTLLWRMKLIPPVQEAAFSDSPQEGFLRILGLAILQDRYFTTGDGRDLFGAQQQIAIDAAVQLEDDAVEIGSRLLTPERQAKVMADVEKIAANTPIVGRDFSLQRVVNARATIRSSESLLGVLALPLAPFRALEGVDSGAQAIRDFNQTARQFAQAVGQLPEQLRTQLELFLYDVEDRDTVVQGLAAIQTMAASAQSASESIDRLPADLQKSLADSQGTLKEANEALQTARDLMVPLTQVTENVKLAGDSWATMFADRRADEPRGRPFDVLDWKATAAQIGTSATEVRDLATSIQSLSGGNQLDAAVDHAAWRAAELVALFFALLVAYRVLTWRLGKARREN